MDSLSGGIIERWNGLHKSHRKAAAANKKYLRAAISLNPSAECFTLDISPRTPVMSPLSRDGEQTNCNLLSPGSTSFVSSGASVHSDIPAMTKVTPNLKTVPPSLLTVEVAGVSLVAMALRTRCTHSYTVRKVQVSCVL